MEKEYAVYQGEKLLATGSAKECAEAIGVKVETIYFYCKPAYMRRVASRKKPRNYRMVVSLDD